MDYINNSLLTTQQSHYLNQLIDRIKSVMSESLFAHSIGTLKFSIKLAKKYLPDGKSNINTFFKLCISSILHDYGKIFTYEELEGVARDHNLGLTDFEISCKPILHSFVGDYLVARDYNISDREILQAIRYHTIGRINMTVLEKILYISDKIEESRSYEGIERLRNLARTDLDLCLREVYKNNIIYNVCREHLLHPDTSLIWNNILRR